MGATTIASVNSLWCLFLVLSLPTRKGSVVDKVRPFESEDNGHQQKNVVRNFIKTEHRCRYGHSLYPPGPFRVDACTTCDCDARQDLVRCFVETCPVQPECIRFEEQPQGCCPECVEYGCFYNGTGFPRGSRIPTDPCRVCFCPWDGGHEGKPFCFDLRCPAIDCVDSLQPDGKCCHVCPSGPNCWLGELLIPADEDVWVGSCRSCRCPELQVGQLARHRHAVCTTHDDCPQG